MLLRQIEPEEKKMALLKRIIDIFISSSALAEGPSEIALVANENLNTLGGE